MEKKYEGLLSKLERELENFAEMQPLERMRSELVAVRASLGKLKEIVLGRGFASQSEEVSFFKLINPRFYALMILSAERYGFEMVRPLRKENRCLLWKAAELYRPVF